MRAVSVGFASIVVACLAAGARADDSAYLGVFIQRVPEPLAAQLGIEGGVLVEDVAPGSPAERGKIERFDVIVAVDDAQLKGPEELKAAIAARKPGDRIRVAILRRGEKKTLEVELSARKEGEEKPRAEAKPPRKGFLGVQLEPVPEVLAVQLRLGEGKGAMVTEALEDSPAKKAGIRRFDVIVAIDGKEIAGPDGVRAILEGKREGERVSVDLIQGAERRKIELTLGAGPEKVPGFPFPPGKGPRSSITRWKGKIILRDDQGNERVFEIPEIGVPRFEFDLPDWPDLEFFHLDRDAVHKELREAERRVKELLEKMRGVGPGAPPLGPHIEVSESFLYKYADGEHEITVQGSGDSRRVTVKKGDETIARDLPWSEIEKLPADVREKLRGLHIEIREGRGPSPAPAPPKPLLPRRGLPI